MIIWTSGHVNRKLKEKNQEKVNRTIIAQIKSKVNKVTSDLGALLVLITLYMKQFYWLNIFWWISLVTFILFTIGLWFMWVRLVFISIMESDKHRVNKLVSDKKEIEKELEDIQSNCNHDDIILKQNRSELKWYCNICQTSLKYPTEAERKKFFKKD